MDESQIAYVKAMRQQIATAKEALLKASGGGSTSEQGSGGDADEAESLMWRPFFSVTVQAAVGKKT